MHSATQTPLILSFANIKPDNEAEFISRLLPQINNYDDIVNFTNDIRLADNTPDVKYYGGNNYLHFATPYPEIFKAILDLCPREQLNSELVKINFFGESVFHKACQHESSLKHALYSMMREVNRKELTPEVKHQKQEEILRIVLLKSSFEVRCYEILIWQKNAKGLHTLLSCFSQSYINLIIKNMKNRIALAETTTSIYDLGMKDKGLRQVLLAYSPEKPNSFFNSNSKRKGIAVEAQDITADEMPTKKMS